MTYETASEQTDKTRTDTVAQEESKVSDQTTSESIDTGIDETTLMSEARDIVANSIVKNHIIASITLGLIPIPLFDISALTATQMNMLRSLSEHYEVPFNDMDIKPLVTSLVAGSLPVVSVLGLSSFAKLIPGVGSLVGSASLGVIAGAVTYAVGQVFIMHFEQGGTLEDFDARQAQAFFKKEFDAGKSFVRDIRDEVKAARKENAGSDDKE